jgi:hypothetical protein
LQSADCNHSIAIRRLQSDDCNQPTFWWAHPKLFGKMALPEPMLVIR